MSTQQKKKKKNNSRLYILIAAVVLLIVMIVLIAVPRIFYFPAIAFICKISAFVSGSHSSAFKFSTSCAFE